jgi:diaminopimelate epimerase
VRVTFPWLKGHGTENDFVLLPDHDGSVHGALDADLVAALCHRRRGIGADGVLRVIRTEALRGIDPDLPRTDAEWFMDYRNSDGSMSEMCGNGIRVFALHLWQEGLAPPNQPLPIGTRGGTRTVTRDEDGGMLTVDMGEAVLLGHAEVGVGHRRWQAHKVSMGNPHAVAFVADLAEAGPLHEPPDFDPADFPHGVNVEFVQQLRPGHIAMRVYERGSGETRSCGTGVCAAAVATAHELGVPLPVHQQVDVPGGVLHVRWNEDGGVELTGPARIVARGVTSTTLLHRP